MKKILVLFIILFATISNAATIELDEGTRYNNSIYDYGGMGSGRGIGFIANSDFHMSTLGMNLGVQSGALSSTYEFEIYGSTDGHNAGSLLNSRSFSLIEGEGWFDTAFDFDFTAGNSYVINFSRIDNSSLGDSLATIYSWEPSSHFDYGVLSTVEGFEGAFPDNGNPLSAHFRIDTDIAPVPEPSTMLLLGSGLAGLALYRRKRK